MSQMVERCDLNSGDWVDSRYRITSMIGNGAFGNVYKAQDASHRDVALKLLRLWDVHPDIRSGLVGRFDMEYETGLIQSPYLVHSLAHGLVKGNPYIVMEFCGRGDVQNLFNQGSLDIITVAVHTLLGLQALHQHGKVHRDLKPENVLLKDNGDYALTDFGISGDRNKRMTEMNIIGKPRQLFGTYAYMPPEQFRPNKDATVLPTTDIFSFGVMMYQLISGGELPFGRLDNEGDLVAYIKNGKNGAWDREALRRRNTEDWIPLLEGCLEPDYQRRLQNCQDVLNYVPNHSNVRKNVVAPPFQTHIVNGVLLRVMQGEEYGTVYPLDNMLVGNSALLTMGRRDPSVHNDISVKETSSAYISRHQCTLELDYRQGCWVIRDGQWVVDPYTGRSGWVSSKNGTFVNSSPASAAGVAFNPGDIISIGDVKLRAEAY